MLRREARLKQRLNRKSLLMVPHFSNLISNCAKQIETCLKAQVKKSHIDYKEFLDHEASQETQNLVYLQNLNDPNQGPITR